jgi:hypothetical protein
MDEDKRRMRPDILQAALLDEVAERLLEMKKIMEEERAFGAVEAIEKFTITSHKIHLPRLKPWMSMTLINDGHDSVFVIVNTDKSFDEHEVLDGETYTIDMHRPRIVDVLLWCHAGETAVVRIVGVR